MGDTTAVFKQDGPAANHLANFVKKYDENLVLAFLTTCQDLRV